MQMTAGLLDTGIISIIIISTMIGLMRGLIRESFSLASWVIALAFTALYFEQVAALLPFEGLSNIARISIAATIIFFCVLIIGAIISYVLKTGIVAIGLSGLDHFLGGLLGFVRGALIVLLVVLLANVASLPDKDWWQQSQLVPKLQASAEWVRDTAMTKLSPLMERFAAAANADS